jgi:nucleoside-diphosphate-sugar epimerase
VAPAKTPHKFALGNDLKALVTGIAGFTGRYLAEELAKRGISVVGIAQSAAAAAISHVDRVHAVDVTDFDALREVILTEKPQLVAHLAGISFVVHADVNEIYRTNLLGTRNLLEALTGLETAPRSVLLASSSNVYGNRHDGIMRETLPPDPVNDYSVSKLAMEYMASLYRAKLPLIIVRPFNYTGRGQSLDFIIPKIIAHARERSPFIELGNLNVARDFSDVRTVAETYVRLLETPDAVGGIFNVCSGRSVTLQEVLDLVTNLSGHRLEVRVDPAFIRANEVRTLCGSAAKLESVIGPLRAIPLEETLRWMLEE